MASAAIAKASSAKQKRRQLIIDAYRVADATSPERARTPADLGLPDSRELSDLCTNGVLLDAPSAGCLYLSEGGYIAWRDAHSIDRTLTKLAFVFVLVALGGILATVLSR